MTASRILLVDDDAVDRLSVRRALRTTQLEHDVDEADGVRRALELMRRDPAYYELVILDYHLPDGDGLALLRQARALGVRAPVIVLTGGGDEQIAVELMKAGASDYLPKTGVTTERLAQSVRAVLRVRDAERKMDEARDALRLQLDTTSAITNSLAEGLIAVDVSGRVTFTNPAAESALGWSHEELLAADLEATIHVHDGEPCRLLESLRTGSVARVDDDHFTRRDGAHFAVSYATSPIVTDGRIIGAVIAFHDITERRRAEAELEQSRRQLVMNEKLSALGTLVSGVAHELRTPLTYIANSIFLMHTRLEATARAHPEFAEKAREVLVFSTDALDGVDRISALVRDLRPFTQAETGQRVTVSLHEVVTTAVDLFRSTHRGKVEVDALLAPTPPITVDTGQVQRVVLNLLSNAAEAMPSGGRIRVITRETQGGAEVVVEDSGEGIPREVESRIFDPFFTTKADGTGLGLAITRRIIDSHGGTIRFISAPNQGTTFFVSFPAAAAETSAELVGTGKPVG